ncbi:MAG: DUF2332 domain-containing protein [Phycisphaerales bacterium]|nr:DUF2332 domain-containing protein [Phycisphaerales bacterium]
MNSERLRSEFAFFATVCAEYCPLYAALSARVAEDETIRNMACGGHPQHPPANLLFGAVHYLLLGGLDHPLREFYPTVGGTRPAADAWPAFRDFCGQFRSEIFHLVATRLVQTNEVGRCGVLLPAFACAFASFNKPLHLIEVGASSGLNLFFDRYRYAYSNGHRAGPASAAQVITELRGEAAAPLPAAMPPIADRVGIDLAPVDVMDDDAMRWLESLIWPDMVDRLTLFRAARDIARQQPPHILAGDAMDLTPEVFAAVNEDALPCILHCHAIYQMDSAWRQQFDELIEGLGRGRDLARISLEWLGDDPGPMLHLTTIRSGKPQRTLLAEAHHHGKWFKWRNAP